MSLVRSPPAPVFGAPGVIGAGEAVGVEVPRTCPVFGAAGVIGVGVVMSPTGGPLPTLAAAGLEAVVAGAETDPDSEPLDGVAELDGALVPALSVPVISEANTGSANESASTVEAISVFFMVVIAFDNYGVVDDATLCGSDCAPKVVVYEPAAVPVGMRTSTVTAICLPAAVAFSSPVSRSQSP
jgi:hypothetical protein